MAHQAAVMVDAWTETEPAETANDCVDHRRLRSIRSQSPRHNLVFLSTDDFPTILRMPRYNATDRNVDADQLDPCMAAKVRLKSSHGMVWKTIFAILAILFLALLITFFFLSWFPKEQYIRLTANPSLSTTQLRTKTPIPLNVHRESPGVDLLGTPLETHVMKYVPLGVDYEASEKRRFPLPTQNDALQTSTTVPELENEETSPSSTHSDASLEPVNDTPSTTSPMTTLRPTSPTTSHLFSSHAPTQKPTINKKAEMPQSHQRTLIRLDPPNKPFVVSSNFVTKNCGDYARAGYQSGVYAIKTTRLVEFEAKCVMDEDGAWMVVQRRETGRARFCDRTLQEYAAGFGDLRGEHWLGLDKVRALLEEGRSLQVKVQVWGDRCSRDGDQFHLVGVHDFSISDRSSGYRLTVSPILQGNFTTPYSDLFRNNGSAFTTVDKDLDPEPVNCAALRKLGAWWHPSGCSFLTLNGAFSEDRCHSWSGLQFYSRTQSKTSPRYKQSHHKPRITQISVRIL